MILRPYQHKMLDEARALLRAGTKRILLQAPTGAGKTVLVATMIGNASARGKRCWFVVHRSELLDQSSATFRECEIPHAIIAAGYAPDPRQRVQVCGVQTLARRLERVTPPDFIVWDEAQHLAAKSWASIAQAFPDAIQVGVSATPERLDGAGLSAFFDEMVVGPSVRQLIDDGWLSTYRYFEPKGVDTSSLHTRMGDFVHAEAEALVDRPTITGSAISEYKKNCDGARAAAFCVSIKHSMHVVAEFSAAGIPAAHIDGDTDRDTRRQTIQRFRNGEFRVLSNVDLLGEGFDLNAIEALIMLRPTQSKSLFLQMIGRALRPMPGKIATINDHVMNRHRHGNPCDEREWSLQGRQKRAKAVTETPVRVCEACYRTLPSAAQSCPCGYTFKPTPREVEQVDGELAEVDVLAQRRERRTEQASAQTIEDLVAIGKARGMKNPHGWAKHVHAARVAKAERRQA